MSRKNKEKSNELIDLPLFAYKEMEQNKQEVIAVPQVISTNVIYMNNWQIEKKNKVVQSDFVSAYMNLAEKIDWK